MPGRGEASGYKYRFNGKESGGEMDASIHLYDYGMRYYESRLNRFMSVDPLHKSYPWYTPFQFAGNNPNWAIDRDGLEEKILTKGGYIINATYTATIEVINNIDICQLEDQSNELLNNNPSLIERMDGFVGPPQAEVQFNIVIVPESPDDDNLSDLSKSRVSTPNGQSLGGRILMGNMDDDGFIMRDADGKILNMIVTAYTKGNNIYLNPRIYDNANKDQKLINQIDSSPYDDITHEIGHDLGLGHPPGIYPDRGIMSNKKDRQPTSDELRTIIADDNERIIQPGNRYYDPNN